MKIGREIPTGRELYEEILRLNVIFKQRNIEAKSIKLTQSQYDSIYNFVSGMVVYPSGTKGVREIDGLSVEIVDDYYDSREKKQVGSYPAWRI